MTSPQTPLRPGGATPAGGGTPRLLDVCSCAGIGARGYRVAGFDVTCVDIEPQPNNPFPFIRADLRDLDPSWIAANFEAIHISPPCQRFTRLRHRYARNDHPDLIGPARDLAESTGLPYVIENVEDARCELVDPVMLCGLTFPGLRVFRHRLFEVSGFTLTAPPHRSHRGVRCHTFDKRKAHYGSTSELTDFVSVNGGGNCSKAAAEDAMGVPAGVHTKRELNEAIPPAYTAFIGEALMSHLLAAVAP